MINHIVAIDKNGCIGNGGALPFHIPKDLKYFKTMTMGSDVYFGRKTFEGLPKINWGSRNPIVLSKGFNLSSINGWVCGGGEIYEATLNMANALYITEVDTVADGDVFYPEFKHLFNMQYASDWMYDNGFKFRFTIWRRKNDYIHALQ